MYTEKHKDDENNKIIKMVGKVKEFTKEQAEKHPKITSVVVKANNFLKKPETQVFLNGMAVGYTIGKISQLVYKTRINGITGIIPKIHLDKDLYILKSKSNLDIIEK